MFTVTAAGFSDIFRQAVNSWAAVDASYRQYTRVLFSSLDQNVFAIAAITELRSFLAEKLKKALVLYQNQEEAFAKDFLRLIAQIDDKSEAERDLFKHYYSRAELSLEHDRSKLGRKTRLVLPRKTIILELFPTEGLDDANRGECFLHHRRHATFAPTGQRSSPSSRAELSLQS